MIQQIDHFPIKDFAGTPNWLNFVSKNIFQELFQTWNPFHNIALWSHHASIWSFFFSIYATKRERKLLMTAKQNENLNKQNLSFLTNKTTKEKLQQTTFRIILLFRQQK